MTVRRPSAVPQAARQRAASTGRTSAPANLASATSARAASTGLVLVLLAACGPIATAGPGCSNLGAPLALPDAVRETSGVAISLEHPDTYWTHNDAGSVLYALNGQGDVVAEFPLSERVRDWEDLALATCPGGGSCLYLADLGDNYEERADLRILRAREPDPTRPDTLHVTSFPVRLPDGPRDVEALLVLPGERILIATKGRNHPVTVYRYPGTLAADTAVLEEVQRLSSGPRIFPRQVTGGAVDPRGRYLALRTYETLRFYTVDADTLVEAPDGVVNLRPLQEAQGEAVAIGLDGQVVLTSEGGPGGGPAAMSKVRCSLGG